MSPCTAVSASPGQATGPVLFLPPRQPTCPGASPELCPDLQRAQSPAMPTVILILRASLDPCLERRKLRPGWVWPLAQGCLAKEVQSCIQPGVRVWGGGYGHSGLCWESCSQPAGPSQRHSGGRPGHWEQPGNEGSLSTIITGVCPAARELCSPFSPCLYLFVLISLFIFHAPAPGPCPACSLGLLSPCLPSPPAPPSLPLAIPLLHAPPHVSLCFSLSLILAVAAFPSPGGVGALQPHPSCLPGLLCTHYKALLFDN